MDMKYKFSFPDGVAQDSIVFSMVTQFKVEPSILRAEIGEDGSGIVILRLRGEEDCIADALRFAKESGVIINELGKHIFRDKEKCFSCGACVSVCPIKAFTVDPKTYEIHLNIDICVACGSCITACSTHAVKLTI